MITFRQGIRDAKISAWACSYHLSQTPKLRAGFSFGIAELSLCTKSCSPTIPAYSQAHFLSPVVNDTYVPPVYACLAVLCIIIYDAVGVLTGNLTAIIMPKGKTLMADILLPRGRKFVLGSKSHISVKNETKGQLTAKHE